MTSDTGVERRGNAGDRRTGARRGVGDRRKRSAALFRRTLASVMAVQVVALVLLWLVQARYSS